MDPAAREYPPWPRLAVGAAIWRDGRVLLARRGQQPNQGLWSLPGGLVELGETLREAIVREIQEECHIEIQPLDLVEVVDLVRRDEAGRVRTHYVVVDFCAVHDSGEPHAASDISDVRWVAPASLPEYGVSEAVLRVVERSRVLCGEHSPGPGGRGATAGS